MQRTRMTTKMTTDTVAVVRCACGCGQDVNPGKKWRSGHHSRKLTPPILVDTNDCWVWQRSTNRYGYGTVKVPAEVRDGTGTPLPAQMLAHRFHYWIEWGWVPPELDHECENRLCVNPDHLRPADSHLNQALMFLGRYLKKIGKNYNPRGLRLSVQRIIEDAADQDDEDDE